MRPSGVTAVASVKTSPAPPTARDPRWTTCHSLAKPSVLEYSHMGDTRMRLDSSSPRRTSGSKRAAMDTLYDRFHMRTVLLAFLLAAATTASAQDTKKVPPDS